MTTSNSVPMGATASVPPGAPLTLGERPPASVRWLWPNRIPLGCLTLVAGEPQAGKSHLTSDIAARTSRGGPWPDQASEGRETSAESQLPGSVLVLSAEENWNTTIRPRLTALGADMTKFHIIGFSSSIDLCDMLERLYDKLCEIPDRRLLVIDPFTAYLGKVGENSGALGRSLIYPLRELAQVKNIAIVLVTHLRRGHGKALHRPTGGDALLRAARAAWLVGEDFSAPGRRVLLPIKKNLGPPATGLAFRLEPVGNGEIATVRWEPEPVLASADDLLCEPTHRPPPRDHKLCAAIDWLEQQLLSGPMPAAEVQAAAAAQGISYGTLRRAFSTLSVQSLRQPRDAQHPFLWQLGGQRPPSAGEPSAGELSNSHGH